VPLAAFLGSLLASILVYGLARGGGRLTTGRLIPAEIAVSYVLTALTSLGVYASPRGEDVRSATFWLLPGLGGAQWLSLALPPLVHVWSLVTLIVQVRWLDALSVRAETAATLGVDPERVRRVCFVVMSLLTGTLVALSGGIGFVGLIVRHVV
jgi:iron complex transport system permease protein